METTLLSSGDLVTAYPQPLLTIRKRYAYHFARIDTTLELRATIRAGAYTWPGGYPLFFLTSDSAALCFDCVQKEYRQISESIRHYYSDGWRVEACAVNWESADLYCEHCDKHIESAYGEE